MKHLHIILLLLLLSGASVKLEAQRVITLDSINREQPGVYIARDTVEFLPGYTFEAGQGKIMKAWVNDSLLTQANYIPSESLPDIYRRPLNTSLSLGTTAGSADVSPTGASTYTIPITVVPGTAGMQPNISINYNSQGGNGLLGWGWNLSAYSAISRSGKTIYHDDKAEEIKLDSTDNLTLDGQRLILVEGNNLKNGAKYRTESESFRDITVKIINDTIYFEVKDKNGYTYLYGNTSDSRCDGIIKTNITYDQWNGNADYSILIKCTPSIWLLSKVIDANGNCMKYTYKKNQILFPESGSFFGEWSPSSELMSKNELEFYLERIDYIGNENVEQGKTFAHVEFLYENRDDSNLSFSLHGSTIKSTLLLRKIKSLYNNEVFREYNLKYTYDRYWTKLVGIEEYNSKGEKYNSTIANWVSPVDNSIQYYSTPSGDPSNECIAFADFDGDGIIDFLSYPKKDNTGHNWDSTAYAKLHLGSYSINTNEEHVVDYNIFTSISLEGVRDLQYGDFNGDGKIDLLKTTPDYGNVDIFGIRPVTGMLYDLATLGTNAFNGFIRIVREAHNAYLPYSCVGDFNGDGKDELVVHCGIYNGQGAKIADSKSIGFEGVGPVKKRFINRRSRVDFLGIGTDMVINSKENGTHPIYRYNGSSWTYLSSIPAYTQNSDTRFFLGDFNGDGLTDVIVREKKNGSPIYTPYYSQIEDLDYQHNDHPINSSYIYFSSLSFSKGTPITTQNINIACNCSTSDNDNFDILIEDFNGDGKADIALCFYSNNTLSVVPFVSTGMEFKQQGTVITFSNTNGSLNNWKNRLAIVDVYGSGKTKVLLRETDRFLVKDIFGDDPGSNLLVSSITNGLDQKTEFTYRSTTEGTVYSKSYSYTPPYPLSANTIPLYLVSGLKKTDASGNVGSDLTFSYENIRTHLPGKGFLGFEKTHVTDNLQGMKTSSRYGLNTTFFDVYLAERKVSKLLNQTLSLDSIEPYYHDYGDKRFFTGVSEKTETDVLTTLSVTTENEYDAENGNITKETVKKGSLVTTNEYTWEQKNNTFKNRLSQSKVTYSGLDGSFTETKNFNFDYWSGRLLSKTDHAGTAKEVTLVRHHSRDFDQFGNALVDTLRSAEAGLPVIITRRMFDSRGRFLEWEKDALDNQTSYTYDPATGNVLSKTTADGHTVSYTYDSWGNLLTETAPGNITTTYARTFVSKDSEPGLYTETASTSGIKEKSQVWYDGWGREVKTQSSGFHSGEDNYVYTSKSYDSSGRLKAESLPYKGNSAQDSVVYTYDDFGRSRSVTDRGRTTWYIYTELMTATVYPDGTTTKVRLNPSGLTATSEDALGGKVEYAYNSLGKPDTITVKDPGATTGGLKTVVGYDERGNRISLKDPNHTANPIRYEYNAYGQLTKETNARGQATVYEYDILGRMVKETRPNDEGIFDYVYGGADAGTGKNRLIAIKKNNEQVQAYTYDTYGNRLTDTETFEGVNYVNSYTYDNLLRLETRTSPSGLQLVYAYNDNGHMTEIRNGEGNALFWQLDSTNVAGQITQSMLGNGLVRKATYDRYDLQTSLTLWDGTTPKDNMAFAFDSLTGNLLGRSDMSHGISESFRYDKLYRLTSTWQGSSFTDSLAYFANGNISKRLNVGNYNYGYNNHAVSAITNPAAGYNPPAPLTMRYNSDNRIDSLWQGSSIDAWSLKFFYGYDSKRRKMQYFENGALKRTRYYIGSYEKEVLLGGTTKEIDYIYLPDGEVAVLEKTNNTRTVRYVHTDHLGSFRTITNSDKSIAAQYSYDAWGVRTLRNGTDLGLRGYTGHEHLDDFGIINMNARLYDPVLGRFLGMDPYVQLPDYTQNFNRYSYAMNNPLVYTDPEGEFIFSILAAIFCPPLLPVAIGTDIGMLQGGIRGATTDGMTFWDGLWRGGITGAIGGAFSMVGGGSFLADLAWGIGEGAITGGLDAALWGNNIGKGMLWGAASGAVFSSINSGVEAINNYNNGYGFKTNEDVVNNLVENANVNGSIDPTAAQKAIDFVQLRYDLTDTNMIYDQTPGAYGITYLDGNIKIGSAAFKSPSILKATMIHEYTHYLSDRIFINGHWQWNLENSAIWNYNDGVRAYSSEILNSGKMHINIKALKMLNPDGSYVNPVWHQMGIRKYWYTIPSRF